MPTLTNLKKTFIKGIYTESRPGQVWGWPCKEQGASTSYLLATESWLGANIGCPGIYLDANGFDKIKANTFVQSNSWDGQYWEERLHIAESDTIDGTYTEIFSIASEGEFETNISKRFLRIWGTIIVHVKNHMGSHHVSIWQSSDYKVIKATAKTPEGYPVYNATIIAADSDDPTYILGSGITDINGETSFEIDILEVPKVKFWGEKTINKTLLNKTAKEISELKSINADKP